MRSVRQSNVIDYIQSHHMDQTRVFALAQFACPTKMSIGLPLRMPNLQPILQGNILAQICLICCCSSHLARISIHSKPIECRTKFARDVRSLSAAFLSLARGTSKVFRCNYGRTPHTAVFFAVAACGVCLAGWSLGSSCSCYFGFQSNNVFVSIVIQYIRVQHTH